MRGVVSLAAAQTLPLDTPYRPLLLTCTIAVIVGTLVVQGLTLPAVIRALHFPGDPRRDRLREKEAATRDANAAIADLVERIIREESIPEPAVPIGCAPGFGCATSAISTELLPGHRYELGDGTPGRITCGSSRGGGTSS